MSSFRVDVDSLQLVKECVRCCNGHRFCLKCLGVWALRQHHRNADDFINDDDDADDNSSQWWNAIHPFNTSALAIPSWLARLQRWRCLFFPLNVEMVYRHPTPVVSARYTRLLDAIALPNVRCVDCGTVLIMHQTIGLTDTIGP